MDSGKKKQQMMESGNSGILDSESDQDMEIDLPVKKRSRRAEIESAASKAGLDPATMTERETELIRKILEQNHMKTSAYMAERPPVETTYLKSEEDLRYAQENATYNSSRIKFNEDDLKNLLTANNKLINILTEAQMNAFRDYRLKEFNVAYTAGIKKLDNDARQGLVWDMEEEREKLKQTILAQIPYPEFMVSLGGGWFLMYKGTGPNFHIVRFYYRKYTKDKKPLAVPICDMFKHEFPIKMLNGLILTEIKLREFLHEKLVDEDKVADIERYTPEHPRPSKTDDVGENVKYLHNRIYME